MDKKEFKAISNQVFEEHGFYVKNKKYFKETKDLIIEIEYQKSSYSNIHYINMYIYIKELYNTSFYAGFARGPIRFPDTIDYLNLDSVEFRDKLIPLIKKCVSPVEKHEIDYIKKHGESIAFPKEVINYITSKNKVKKT